MDIKSAYSGALLKEKAESEPKKAPNEELGARWGTRLFKLDVHSFGTSLDHTVSQTYLTF